MDGLDEEKQNQTQKQKQKQNQTQTQTQMQTTTTTTMTTTTLSMPRVRILYCVQCKWMLRAAYFAQELLSTFSNSLGEVALVPSTGGVFVIDITYIVVAPTDITSSQAGGGRVLSDIPSTKQTTRLWDRKVDGGFPETKTLKKLVRDIIDPTRNLGHVDGHKKAAVTNPTPNKNDINTDDLEKESSGRDDHVVVAGGGPILLSIVDVANKSGERGLTTKESDQGKKVCDDCA